jgi:hypothetical protein
VPPPRDGGQVAAMTADPAPTAVTSKDFPSEPEGTSTNGGNGGHARVGRRKQHAIVGRRRYARGNAQRANRAASDSLRSRRQDVIIVQDSEGANRGLGLDERRHPAPDEDRFIGLRELVAFHADDKQAGGLERVEAHLAEGGFGKRSHSFIVCSGLGRPPDGIDIHIGCGQQVRGKGDGDRHQRNSAVALLRGGTLKHGYRHRFVLEDVDRGCTRRANHGAYRVADRDEIVLRRTGAVVVHIDVVRDGEVNILVLLLRSKARRSVDDLRVDAHVILDAARGRQVAGTNERDLAGTRGSVKTQVRILQCDHRGGGAERRRRK